MGMRNVSILIPSYKRPEVLKKTLEGLYTNTFSEKGYKISICLGLNKVSEKENKIASEYRDLFIKNNINFVLLSFEKNIGKAKALNSLLSSSDKDSNYIITMDNDMVIKKAWLHYIDRADKIDYDLMGFSSAKFWAHEPSLKRCPYIDINGYIFYKPVGIAGGMMLFHKEFLEKHTWTNHGGVYGRDDADMCLKTSKKYVLHSTEDWLDHDPLNSSTPLLKAYEDKKRSLYKRNINIFPEGWDE
jgi:glycosyltransferase involved in cell wall biosynthesis